MSWQDLGAIGEVVGGVGVILSLIYVAYQIRQSSHQIELNSRHIEASMYVATNDGFMRWQALLAQDETLAALWWRALRGEQFSDEESVRFGALMQLLFAAYENNFIQLSLGTIKRDTIQQHRPLIASILGRPAAKRWWAHEGSSIATPEFSAVIDALLAEHLHGRSPKPGTSDVEA